MCEFECKRCFLHWNLHLQTTTAGTAATAKSFGDELTRKAFSNGIRERKREKIFSIRSYNKQDEKCGERERYRENWRTMDWNKFCYGIWIWLLSVFTTHTHMPILHTHPTLSWHPLFMCKILLRYSFSSAK